MFVCDAKGWIRILQCVVIADDITGGNATGVLLARQGLRVHSVFQKDLIHPQATIQCDCVVYSTNSRSVAPDEAYRRVSHAIGLFKYSNARVYAKRIDSTLRGNLGSEVDAMLDALDDGVVAMVVPCYPGSYRINVGGYLLVNAVPLHRTAAAADPVSPVKSSCCAEILRSQSKHAIGTLYLDDLMRGEKHLAQKILSFVQQGLRIIVFDAISQEDIDCIAEAVVLSGVDHIAVDPGNFTAALAKLRCVAPVMNHVNGRILAVVGSVNTIAANQTERFLATYQGMCEYFDAEKFIQGESQRQAEIDRVVTAVLSNSDRPEVCSIIGRGIYPEHRLDLVSAARPLNSCAEALSNQINTAIAEIACDIISADVGFAGLYTSGGDISVAVLKRVGAMGLQLCDEVVPLAAYGYLIGGQCEGLHIVTKGGMVGDPDAMLTCIDYLRNRL